jgi:DNA-binding transcriptional LysR family regulator
MDLLAHMRVFVRVVDAGTLSAAARSLDLSVPQVSRQVAALETHVGTVLLRRTTRRVEVTEAGTRFHQHCMQVLRDVDLALDSIGESSAKGRVVISAPATLGRMVVGPAVRALLSRERRLGVDLRLEDRAVDLVAEGVDLAVRSGTALPETGQLIARGLGRYRRVLVASPAYLARAGMPASPSDLGRHDVAVHLPAEGASGLIRLVRGAEVRIIDVSGSFRSTAPHLLQDAATDGHAVALLPEWLVAGDLARGTLSRILPEWCSPPVEVSALHPVDLRGARRIQVIVDALRRAFSALEGDAEDGPPAARSA